MKTANQPQIVDFELSPELAEFRDRVRAYAADLAPQAAGFDSGATFPKAAVEKAAELGMIIQIHTGWSGFGRLALQHPLLLDDVAVRVPELKLIVVHAGENYYEEVVMMMLKNPNMYAGTGWWGFLQPLETNIRFLKYAKHFMVLDKCLWGTDNFDCREDVPYTKSFPRLARELNIAPGLPELTDEDIDDYLGGNAARLYGVEKD